MHVIYRAEVRHIFSRTHENDMQAGPTCSHVFLDLTSCNPACFLWAQDACGKSMYYIWS